LKSRLEEEIADVFAACAFVIETNGLDEKAIESRAKQKMALFAAWHNAQKVKP
jgi:NTP pyrophosphatase (non-canonical NTP hydrolase)